MFGPAATRVSSSVLSSDWLTAIAVKNGKCEVSVACGAVAAPDSLVLAKILGSDVQPAAFEAIFGEGLVMEALAWVAIGLFVAVDVTVFHFQRFTLALARQIVSQSTNRTSSRRARHTRQRPYTPVRVFRGTGHAPR